LKNDRDIHSTNMTEIKTELNRLQREGSSWLREREKANVRGGLFCDDPGLGKTLTMLDCLLKQEGTTLVVCPSQVIDVWHQEIIKHTNLSLTRVNVYHGRGRRVGSLSAKIHLTSYGVLTSEYKLKQADEPTLMAKDPFKKGSLFYEKFDRVVFDEAHFIRNRQGKRFQASLLIRAGIKWIMTATPVSNDLDEFYPYFRVLGVVDNFPGWRNKIPNHKNTLNSQLRAKLNRGVLEINGLKAGMYLKRTKADLDDLLPQKTERIVNVDMRDLERTFYDSLLKYSCERLDFMRDRMKNPLFKEYANSLRGNALTLILRLRQACVNPLLVIKSMKQFRHLLGEEEPEEMMQAAIKFFNRDINLNEEECGICYDQPNVKLSCGHLVCRECLTASRKVNSMCPMCRTYISDGDWKLLEETDGGVIEKHDDNAQDELETMKKLTDEKLFERSAKMEKTIDLIKDHLPNKTIVVSQWTGVLEMMAKRLRDENISLCRIEGKVSQSQRQHFINEFQHTDEPKVALISLTCSAEGITLTKATRMIFLDQWWNLNGRIEQMSNRIHRLGQEREVDVVHLRVSNTIEDTIEKYVKRKVNIVNLVDKTPERLEKEQRWWYDPVKLVDWEKIADDLDQQL